MSDQEVIRRAYEEQISSVYKAFVAAFTNAQGNPAGEQQAKDHFRVGVLHARNTRDLALSLLP